MDIERNDHIEIEHADGLGVKSRDIVYTERLPDVIVGGAPVELQDFYYSPDGRGRRVAYGYRPTVTLEFKNNQFPAPLKSKLHRHDYFELMLVASGKLGMQIESQLCGFNSWDLCVLNRATRHAEHFEPEGRIVYLVLSPEYLSEWPLEVGSGLQHSMIFSRFFGKGLRDAIRQNKDYIAARYKSSAELSPLHGIVQEMRTELDGKRPGYQLIVRGLLFRFFSVLADPAFYEMEYTDLGADDGFSLAWSAKQILDRNKRKMTKREIADQLNYSSEHISRIFERHYGQTIHDYNRTVCLQQAALLLSTSHLHIHDICKQLGFVNRTHFYGLFEQEYGCTPADYRKRGTAR